MALVIQQQHAVPIPKVVLLIVTRRGCVELPPIHQYVCIMALGDVLQAAGSDWLSKPLLGGDDIGRMGIPSYSGDDRTIGCCCSYCVVVYVYQWHMW